MLHRERPSCLKVVPLLKYCPLSLRTFLVSVSFIPCSLCCSATMSYFQGLRNVSTWCSTIPGYNLARTHARSCYVLALLYVFVTKEAFSGLAWCILTCKSTFGSVFKIIVECCFGGDSAFPLWTSISTPANLWGPFSHVQDYPWSPGIPHGNHLCLSNPPRATRPRIQVPPTAMLHEPSPIRLHRPGSPFWNKLPAAIVNASSVKSFKALLNTRWQFPVPRGTHLTHLLPQPIPSAHIDSHKNSHPNDPSHIPTPPPGRL